MLEVLYEDNHILVVNKPAGILTQPSGTDQLNIEDISKQYLKEKYHKPGKVFLEAVHRIDKPVSGVVLFARTSKALSRLQASMREKTRSKNIMHLWKAILPILKVRLSITLSTMILRQQSCPKKTSDSKLAKLNYKLLEKKKEHRFLSV